jgi:catechol 2,3-dioxygenase-like lactoylglutathione lyase family enzyme
MVCRSRRRYSRTRLAFATCLSYATRRLAHRPSAVPGILWLEHVNLRVGERELAEAFFVDFLGFVREPGRSWHLNLGSQQVHLESAPAGLEHQLTGSVGLTVPSVDDICSRADHARKALGDTAFAVSEVGERTLAVTDPWGSTFVCREPPAPPEALTGLPKMVALHVGQDEGPSVRARGQPGIRCVELRARPGTAARIGRFYEVVFGASVSYTTDPPTAAVLVGPAVHLVFHEVSEWPLTDAQEARQAGDGKDGTGLHIAVYINGFKHAYDELAARGLVWTNPRFARLDTCDTWAEAVASRQLRFQTIVDVETGEPLLTLEHEVRAARHAQFFKKVYYPL